MNDYSPRQNRAQPIRDSVNRIMAQIIANAEPPDVQKEMILIAHENRLITTADCFNLIKWYGLEGV